MFCRSFWKAFCNASNLSLRSSLNSPFVYNITIYNHYTCYIHYKRTSALLTQSSSSISFHSLHVKLTSYLLLSSHTTDFPHCTNYVLHPLSSLHILLIKYNINYTPCICYSLLRKYTCMTERNTTCMTKENSTCMKNSTRRPDETLIYIVAVNSIFKGLYL